jgi:hypothetical protein
MNVCLMNVGLFYRVGGTLLSWVGGRTARLGLSGIDSASPASTLSFSTPGRKFKSGTARGSTGRPQLAGFGCPGRGRREV